MVQLIIQRSCWKVVHNFFISSRIIVNQLLPPFLDLLLPVMQIYQAREAQSLCIQEELVLPSSLGQDCGNAPCILNSPKLDIASRLLDCITNKLGRAGFSLCFNNHSLLLLTSTIDNKGSSLGFLPVVRKRGALVIGICGIGEMVSLLSNLLSLNSRSKFWREC